MFKNIFKLVDLGSTLLSLRTRQVRKMNKLPLLRPLDCMTSKAQKRAGKKISDHLTPDISDVFDNWSRPGPRASSSEFPMPAGPSRV